MVQVPSVAFHKDDVAVPGISQVMDELISCFGLLGRYHRLGNDITVENIDLHPIRRAAFAGPERTRLITTLMKSNIIETLSF